MSKLAKRIQNATAQNHFFLIVIFLSTQTPFLVDKPVFQLYLSTQTLLRADKTIFRHHLSTSADFWRTNPAHCTAYSPLMGGTQSYKPISHYEYVILVQGKATWGTKHVRKVAWYTVRPCGVPNHPFEFDFVNIIDEWCTSQCES